MGHTVSRVTGDNIDVRIGELQQGDYGCLAVLAVVLAVEVAGAQRQQMISHAVARYKRAHPVVTTAVVLTTAFHLLEWLDPDVDPFPHTYALLSRLRRQKMSPATAASITAISGT